MADLLTTSLAYKTLKGNQTSETSSAPKSLQESIFQKPLTWLIITGVALYFGSKAIKSLKTNKDLQAASQDVSDLEKTQVASYTEGQYNIWAQQLLGAMSGLGTDEDAIFRVFNFMKNDLDVAKLVKAFGVRDNESLSEWLAGDLSNTDIQKINTILKNKKIKYQF